MKILLLGNYPPDRQESMLRFAELMHRELTALGHTVKLLQPQPTAVRLKPGNKWLGYVDKFLLFPATLKRHLGRYDLVHICDHSNAMYVKHLGAEPHVVTCHDVLAIKSALGEILQNPVSSTGRYFQSLILAGLRRARYTVCDSEASRTDLLRVTGNPPASATVVYLSLNYPYVVMPRAEALARLDALSFDARLPFFVHVGASVWYKNKLALLEIFRQLRLTQPDARLLTIGNELDPACQAYIAQHDLGPHIHRLSGISNEDLNAVYSLAQALIFPSLQEGFGWPVLEAQACGCPVFATNRAPMTELGGTAAIYFDPAEPVQAAQIITAALPGRDRIIAEGLTNVAAFNVPNMIAGYLAAYNKVLEQ